MTGRIGTCMDRQPERILRFYDSRKRSRRHKRAIRELDRLHGQRIAAGIDEGCERIAVLANIERAHIDRSTWSAKYFQSVDDIGTHLYRAIGARLSAVLRVREGCHGSGVCAFAVRSYEHEII